MEKTIEKIMLHNGEISFSDVVEKSRKIQEKCTDYTMTGARIAKVSQDVNKFRYYTPDLQTRIVTFSDHSFNQLCTHLGINSSYMSRCIEKEKPELAAYNVNEWLKDNDRDFFIREYQDDESGICKMRGMLTPRYSVLDTPDILDIIGESMNLDNYLIKGSFITPERFHLRLVDAERLPIDGEDLFGGISIDTSDVGRCGLMVQYFVFKQVCTNGLCVSRGGGMLYRQKHIGINKDEFALTLQGKLKDVNEFQKELVQEIISAKREHLCNMDVEKILAQLKIAQGIGDKKIENIINLMDTRYGRNRFGLINGITEVAQEYSLDKRLELERYAGKLLVA